MASSVNVGQVRSSNYIPSSHYMIHGVAAPHPKPLRPVVPPRVAAPRVAPVDPFAPLTQQQINTNAVNAINAQIGPVLKQITDAINARSQAGSDAISKYTQMLMGSTAGEADKVKSIYADAESNQSAVDNALNQTLTGGGQADAQALTDQLAKAGQNTAPVQQVASAGASAGQTRMALGSAGLAQLIAQSAAAQTYAAKLPGIQGATGAQMLKDFQAQLANELSTQTGQIRSQVPGMINTYVNDATNREYQKAVARDSGIVSNQKTNQKLSYQQASIDERIRHDQAVERNTSLSIQERDLARQDRVTAQQQKQAQTQQKTHQKAIGTRDKAFDSGRRNAYSKALSYNGKGGSNLLTSTGSVSAQQAYQELWAQYGKPLMRYTSASGRAGWHSKIDNMIKGALAYAGYQPPSSGYPNVGY